MHGTKLDPNPINPVLPPTPKPFNNGVVILDQVIYFRWFV